MDDLPREYFVDNADERFRDIVSRAEKPWDKPELLRLYMNDLGFKDVIMHPRIHGKRNKIKYDPMFAISSVTKIIGGQPKYLKNEVLKDFEFMTILDLEKKIQTPQNPTTRKTDSKDDSKQIIHWSEFPTSRKTDSKDDSKQIIQTEGFRQCEEISSKQLQNEELTLVIPPHLCDSRKNQRFFVSYTAIMTYIRHVAGRGEPVLVKNRDVRDEARKLLQMLDGMDSFISDMIDDLIDTVQEYKTAASNKMIDNVKEREDKVEKDRERLRLESEAKANDMFPDKRLVKGHTLYFMSSCHHLNMTIPVGKFGVSNTLFRRLNGHQGSLPEMKILFSFECYDGYAAEHLLKKVYEDLGLIYKPQGCKACEWIYILNVEDIRAKIKIIVDKVNQTYEEINEHISDIRELYVERTLEPVIEEVVLPDANKTQEEEINEILNSMLIKCSDKEDVSRLNQVTQNAITKGRKCVEVIWYGYSRQDVSRFRCKETGGYFWARANTVIGLQTIPLCPCCVLKDMIMNLYNHSIILKSNIDFDNYELLKESGVLTTKPKWEWTFNEYRGLNLSLQRFTNEKASFNYGLGKAFSCKDPSKYINVVTQELLRPIKEIPSDAIATIRGIIVTQKYLEKVEHRVQLRKILREERCLIPYWLDVYQDH